MTNTVGIGIDIGSEIKFSSKEKQFRIPNVIGSSDPIGFGELTSDKSWENNLILIENEEEFYIGELARTQSEIKQFILDQGNLEKIDEIFQIIKSILPLIVDKEESDIILGIGVPISTSVKRMKELSAKIKGKCEIKIKNEATNEIIEVEKTIKKAFIMPQSYGSYYSIVSNLEKGIALDAVVISLDLLTEILTVYNGEIIRTASLNLTNASLFVLANKISQALQQQTGEIVNPHTILGNIRKKQDQVILAGKNYDIGNVKEHYIRQIANDIVDNLSEVLNSLPLEADVEYYIITGEAVELFWTEIEMLILEHNLIRDLDLDRIIKVEDPIFSNSIGFEKMVKKQLESGE
ncbi:MAG: ParM/StbA family protein [Promethearchaeia archaeon]